MLGLAEQLHITEGITAIIGSGGKTTLLYRLAQELSECGSVIVTTTTHIFRPEHLPFCEQLNAPVRGIVCVGTPCENGKLRASMQEIRALCTYADYVLVEADGAAKKPLKAHASDEPVIPESTQQVLCVLGASGLFCPISEAVHRPERFFELTGSMTATPQAVAAALLAERLFDRLIINQCDKNEQAAHALAELLPSPVLLTDLQRGVVLCSF